MVMWVSSGQWDMRGRNVWNFQDGKGPAPSPKCPLPTSSLPSCSSNGHVAYFLGQVNFRPQPTEGEAASQREPRFQMTILCRTAIVILDHLLREAVQLGPEHPLASLFGCTKNARPWVLFSQPFLRVEFAMRSLKGWGNISQTKSRLAYTHYKSGRSWL